MTRLNYLLFLAGTTSMAGNAPAADPSGLCAIALKAVPAATECRPTPGGAIIGKNAAAVEAVARSAADGEQKFRSYFGRPVPRYVVSFFVEDQSASKALRLAKFDVVLPWLDPEAKSAAIDQSVRRAVLNAQEGKNIAPEQIEAMIAQAKSKMPQVAAGKAADTDAGAVSHELGHQWFMRSFWPGQNVGKLGHYGGPAPDWLDELAAVLHENDPMTADRRRQFKAVYLQQPDRKVLPDNTTGELTDLQTYLSREHPANRGARDALSKMRNANGSKRSQDGVTILTGAEALEVSKNGLIFYLQSRAFADFMIERTGNPKLFAEIAVADASGVSFPQWLAKGGIKYRLAPSVSLLEKQWQAWLKVKHSNP